MVKKTNSYNEGTRPTGFVGVFYIKIMKILLGKILKWLKKLSLGNTTPKRPYELTCLLCNHSFNYSDIELYGNWRTKHKHTREIQCPNCRKMI